MDEFTWTDSDEVQGRVIGYEETRLEQPHAPEDVAAMLSVGCCVERTYRSAGNVRTRTYIQAEPIYLTADEAVDVALQLLDAAATWRAHTQEDHGAPQGPVLHDDEERRWKLHVAACSVEDWTVWVQRDGQEWKATEVETAATYAPGITPQDALLNLIHGRLPSDYEPVGQSDALGDTQADAMTGTQSSPAPESA